MMSPASSPSISSKTPPITSWQSSGTPVPSSVSSDGDEELQQRRTLLSTWPCYSLHKLLRYLFPAITGWIPFLQKLPPWLYALATVLKGSGAAMNGYWYALSKEGATRSKAPCFSKYVLDREKDGLKPKEIAQLTANLIGGGVDTTTSTMLSFILAAVAFSEAIKPAHEEI